MINFLNSEVGCSEVLYASELVEKYYSSYFKVIIFLAIFGVREVVPVFGYKHTKGMLLAESLPEIALAHPSYPSALYSLTLSLHAGSLWVLRSSVALSPPLFAHNWTFGREENSESANNASIRILHTFTRCHRSMTI